MSEAGISVARSHRLDHQYRLFGLSEYNLAASSAVEGLPDEQRSSPVRRTFLLCIVFEFVCSFVLWLIYMKTKGNFIQTLNDEILNYGFNSSLFDTQVFSAVRFIFLEIAYGVFFVSYRWPSALSTATTTFLVIVKSTLFNNNNNPVLSSLSYALLMFSIVMSWISTIFLECRVLPQERVADQISKNLSRFNTALDERPGGNESLFYPSIRQWAARAATYYTASVYGSPEGSVVDVDVDTESLLGPHKFNNYGATESAVDVAALLTEAGNLRKRCWEVYDSDAWGCEINKVSSCPALSLEALFRKPPKITSANLPGYKQKLFRLDGYINAPAKTLFNDMVHGVEQTSHWNSTVSSAKYLQKFQGENLDIVHIVAKDVLGGIIKSRDFVVLRAWGQERGVLYVASTSVTHPKCAPSCDSIRAVQLINTIMLQSVGKSCRLVWITGIDLKGWFPSNVIERGISASLLGFFNAVQSRASTLCVNVNPTVPLVNIHRSLSTLSEAC